MPFPGLAPGWIRVWAVVSVWGRGEEEDPGFFDPLPFGESAAPLGLNSGRLGAHLGLPLVRFG